MESQSLEQLLDCPVCFERLDGTNRVLPCQHTFCKKCLEKVKSRFKELRCPECRFKYTGSINELNCNILVMRILEQIKQSEKEALKSKKSSHSLVKQHSDVRTDLKSPIQNNDRKSHLNDSGKSTVAAFINHNGDSYVRYRANINRLDHGPVALGPSNTSENSSGSRVIIGAVRKQGRTHEDGSIRSSSMFARPIIPALTTTETATHSVVRANEVSAFNPNSYTFTVELKSSDRSSFGGRRSSSNKNYVKPSILNAVSNSSVIRSSGSVSGNLFDAFAAAATTPNSSAITSSASQSVSVLQSVPKNYLSFSPGSYTFNVNLKCNERGTQKKKNYLS